MVQTGPGRPSWPENLEKDLTQDKRDSINGYTIGDNTHKNISRYPWRMDDEKVAYKGRSSTASRTSACTRACSRRGKQFPHLRGFCDVADEPLT